MAMTAWDHMQELGKVGCNVKNLTRLCAGQ